MKILKLRIFCVAAAMLVPVLAPATQGVRNYPRVAQAASALGEYDDAQVDSLSWYDIIAFSSSPFMVEQVRERNPDIELLFLWLPQTILAYNEDETFWHSDTTWSLPRLAQFYALQNDWYLRDTSGERIAEWGAWASNWTRYCPKGTYGTSRGLTYAEWLMQVAIPQIIQGGGDWEPWGPGSSAYQGFLFEVFADCVGSFGYMNYIDADPDRDGLAEGVTAGCASGGAQDSLSILYRQVNDWFGPALTDLMDDDLIVIINSGNRHIAPAWHDQMTGQKIESWLQSPPHPAWVTWWHYFYELTNSLGTDMRELGYVWAEENMGSTGRDEIDGWDHSLIQVIIRDYYSMGDRERWKRFGLGTSMLGDGYFMFSAEQRWPHWQHEFDWDFGEPLGPFSIETYPVVTAADSVYVRLFEKGMVEVNPNEAVVKGIPQENSRFTFWQPVTDLAARAVGGTTIRIDFTAPDEELGPIDKYHIRHAPWPITLANWNSATESVAPVVIDPSHAVSLLIPDLPSSQRVYFAVRNEVHTDLEQAISNVTSAITGFPQTDHLPPSSIGTFTLLTAGDDFATVRWIAPGDDGAVGRAALYDVRVLRGASITSQSAWNAAERVPDMTPFPAMPGQIETFTITGLVPGTMYGGSVRTFDDRTNTSWLSNPLTIITTGEPPPVISDAPEVAPRTSSWARLWPSPFSERLTIEMLAPLRLGELIDVLDASGRSLTTLVGMGTSRIEWDGTDRRGHRLPSGTYWLRRGSAEGAGEAAIRVTVVR